MLGGQLTCQVGQHAARDLILKCLDIDTHVLRVHETVLKIFLTDRSEIISDFGELVEVKTCIVLCTAESFNHDFCSRLGCSQSERADCAVKNIGACLDGFHICHGSASRCVMRMHLDRQRRTCLQSGDQLSSSLRDKKTGHILDADRISAHIFDFFGHCLPIIKRISIAQCIGKSDLSFSALLLGCLYACLKVSEVIQAVEDSDDIDAVRDRLLYEICYDIIGIRLVA